MRLERAIRTDVQCLQLSVGAVLAALTALASTDGTSACTDKQ
jgi:hypothetical protein